LAQRFDGEIINGDAMQMYEGIPIITNKMPVHERKGIPHHLIGGIGLDQPTWTVGQFVAAALKIVFFDFNHSLKVNQSLIESDQRNQE
jgi:tRNA dimethylallyltransferase